MTSSNAFANGMDQNCNNVLTDRRTTRTHAPPGGASSISFGDDGVMSANARQVHVKPSSEGKAREHAGSGIFDDAPGYRAPANVSTTSSTTSGGDGMKRASTQDIKAMMIADLRQLCRAHGLTPAGSRDTLIERVCDALASGEVDIRVPEKGTSGVKVMENNYTRDAGQNVGNFLTDRASSRVLREPGGGSSVAFGGANGSAPARASSVTAQARQRAMSSNIFGDDAYSAGTAAAPTSAAVANVGQPRLRQVTQASAAKLAEISGNDVFDQSLPPRMALSSHRQASINAIRGVDIFDQRLPPRRAQRGGVKYAAGGQSSINFGTMFDELDDVEGAGQRADDPDDDDADDDQASDASESESDP
jgi:protein SPIRAL1 and related proteins